MASILQQNVVTVTVNDGPTTGHARKLVKDTQGELAEANSDAVAPDNQIEIHESDKKWLEKYGIVS